MPVMLNMIMLQLSMHLLVLDALMRFKESMYHVSIMCWVVVEHLEDG
jgi:hypothetical protein